MSNIFSKYWELTEKEIFEKERKKPLTKDEINDLTKDVSPIWKLEKDPDKLVAELELDDFVEVMGFVNKLALIAEKMNHHPNIYIHSWKKVRLTVWTHQIGGLHKIDFVLASKIDKLLKKD